MLKLYDKANLKRKEYGTFRVSREIFIAPTYLASKRIPSFYSSFFQNIDQPRAFRFVNSVVRSSRFRIFLVLCCEKDRGVFIVQPMTHLMSRQASVWIETGDSSIKFADKTRLEYCEREMLVQQVSPSVA